MERVVTEPVAELSIPAQITGWRLDGEKIILSVQIDDPTFLSDVMSEFSSVKGIRAKISVDITDN